MKAIEAQSLTKTYPGGVEAVKGVDFQVEAGEVFGLLGPNGAGKSTTVGMLTTTIIPTTGRARVAGYDVVRQPLLARGSSSVVFQEPVVDRSLTGRANLELHARLWGSGTEARMLELAASLGAVRADRTTREHLQRWRAAPPRNRAGPPLRPCGPVPRRAHGGARPEDQTRAARRHRRTARVARADDSRHHALPRRGPAIVRPRGHRP